ncbi:MAG: 3-oxoacyl-ACP reductase family protein [Minicystis sp.]
MTTRLLEGKRCVVTGGSRGLGLAIARAFARHGARVAFTYASNDDDAREAAAQVRESGVDPLVIKGSVADAAQVKAAVTQIVTAFGGVDVLVNNAGLMQVLPISLLEEADWDQTMSVNVKGAYLWSRAVLKSMIRNRGGSILSIGNFATGRIVESPVHYAASKAALTGFTEALAREVGRYAIRVNLLAPGLLDTGMSLGLPQHRQREYLQQCALGRLGRADEIAEAAAFLVSDDNSFMTGAKLVLDGGL